MPKGRGRKDSDSDAATEDLGTVGTFETLRDEGEHFVHVKQWEKAIESFTKALEMKNGDKTCLVVRSKCFLMLGDSEKALADADEALEQSEEGKKDIRALCMKAEALYQKGDFETALVFYHRGNKLRSELQEFRLGIQKCQEAINNSIGSPSDVQLESSGDLSYFYKQEEKAKQQQKGYTKVGQPQRKDEKKERQRPKDGTNSKTTKELLGQLYQDKEYLEKLFDSLSTNNSQTDEYVKGRACDGIEYLKGRSDFWLQQKPMYARKRERQRVSKSGKGRVADPERYVLRRLEDIDSAFSAGNYSESLDKSKKTLKKVEEFSEDQLNNKKAFEASLHSCMGNAHFEMENYSQALTCHEMDLKIAQDNEIEEAESRALDNVGRTHAKLGNFEDAVEIWSKKLPMSKSPLESTWLYHEIGRCNLELGEYQEARDYGEKAIAAAKEADDPAWILHAYVLTAQSEVKCGELEAATDSFTKALELAEEQDDVSGQTAIKRALEEVNALIVKGEQQGEDGEEEAEAKGSDDDKKEDTTKTATTTTKGGAASKGGTASNAKTKGGDTKDDNYEDETFEKDTDDEKQNEEKKDSNDKLAEIKNSAPSETAGVKGTEERDEGHSEEKKASDDIEEKKELDDFEEKNASEDSEEKKALDEPEEQKASDEPEEQKASDVPEEQKSSDVPEEQKASDVPEEQKASDVPEEQKASDVPEEQKASDEPENENVPDDSEEKNEDNDDQKELSFAETDLNRKGDDKNESKA